MNLDYIMQLGPTEIMVYIIKLYFINLCTYFMNFKIMNISAQKTWKEKLKVVLIIMVITLICKFVDEWLDFLYLVISMIILIATLFSIKSKKRTRTFINSNNVFFSDKLYNFFN